MQRRTWISYVWRHTALPFALFLSPYDRARVYVRVRVHSTACGRPRLASGLYRDYICKTIRLNHFLNKRAWPRPPLASSGPGQIGERSSRVARTGRREGRRKGVRFNPWVKYSVARFNICSRNSPSPARRLTVSATRPRNVPRSEINELARVTD